MNDVIYVNGYRIEANGEEIDLYRQGAIDLEELIATSENFDLAAEAA